MATVERNYRIPAGGGLLLILAMFLGSCTEAKDPQDEPDWQLQSHYQKGSVALGEGNLEAAEKEFRTVLTMDAKHVGAHNKLARILQVRAANSPPGTELIEEAIALLTKSTALDPKSTLTWKQLARAYRQAGQYQKAFAAYEKLLGLDDADTSSRLAVAEMHEEMGNPSLAEKVFQEGVKKHPQSGSLLLAYGRFLVKQKKDTDAKAILVRIPANQAEYYEALDELGAIAARAGQFDEVRRVYRSMVDINPQDFMVWELLAAVDEREKKFEEAEQNYRRSLDIDREHMSGWIGLGRCLLAQNKRDEAVYAFRKADGFLGRDPARSLELVDDLVVLGDLGWARSVLERAKIIASEPDLVERIEKKIEEIKKSPNEPGEPPAPDKENKKPEDSHQKKVP